MNKNSCRTFARASCAGFFCLLAICNSAFSFQIRLPYLSLQPYEDNPILRPRNNDWETKAVCQPAAIVKDSTVYLFYRAEDNSGASLWNGTSRIGMATSTDGIHFTRAPKPAIVPTYDYETPGGCENPRLVEIEGVYYMTYAAFDGHTSRLVLASSRDLQHWIKHGLIFPEAGWTSAGAIVPQRINGRFVMYFSDRQNLRLAYSENLLQWRAQEAPVMQPRAEMFDNAALVPGPPLILGNEVILFYNGISPTRRAQPAQAVFSLQSPETLLARSERPYWSMSAPNAEESTSLFLAGLVRFQEEYFLYFDMNEEAVGVAVSKNFAAQIRAQK